MTRQVTLPPRGVHLCFDDPAGVASQLLTAAVRPVALSPCAPMQLMTASALRPVRCHGALLEL